MDAFRGRLNQELGLGWRVIWLYWVEKTQSCIRLAKLQTEVNDDGSSTILVKNVDDLFAKGKRVHMAQLGSL